MQCDDGSQKNGMMYFEDRGRNNNQELQVVIKSWKRQRKGLFPKSLQRNYHCWHLKTDFELLTFRTKRE